MSANAILKLQAAGFTVEQVTALADLIDTQAASKTDLAGAEHRLDTRIIEAKSEQKTDIASVKADIAAARSEAKIDAANLETRLVRWMVGTGVAAVLAIGGLIVALVRYLPATH